MPYSNRYHTNTVPDLHTPQVSLVLFASQRISQPHRPRQPFHSCQANYCPSVRDSEYAFHVISRSSHVCRDSDRIRLVSCQRKIGLGIGIRVNGEWRRIVKRYRGEKIYRFHGGWNSTSNLSSSDQNTLRAACLVVMHCPYSRGHVC